MAKLTEDMRELIEKCLAYVGTVDSEGSPNVAPKGSMRIDNGDLIFMEGIGRKTLENLRENPKVTVACVDREEPNGYQFKGEAEVVEEGTLYDKFAKISEEKGRRRPKAVVKIKIEEIYSLKPGPEAGKRVA